MSAAVWRTLLCRVALAAVLAMPATAAAPTAIRSDAALARSILDEVNAVRRAHGLEPRTESAELERAAALARNSRARDQLLARAAELAAQAAPR